MSKPLQTQSHENSNGSNKRLIILGAILVVVFVAWVVMMLMSPGVGRP